MSEESDKCFDEWWNKHLGHHHPAIKDGAIAIWNAQQQIIDEQKKKIEELERNLKVVREQRQEYIEVSDEYLEQVKDSQKQLEDVGKEYDALEANSAIAQNKVRELVSLIKQAGCICEYRSGSPLMPTHGKLCSKIQEALKSFEEEK